jgi:hypothetical protein
MRSPGPVILGVPAGLLGNMAGLSPWLAGFVVAASLVLGLVQAIVPQNSADRLNLLLALRRTRKRSATEARHRYALHPHGQSCPGCRHADSHRVTVVGQLSDDQEQ